MYNGTHQKLNCKYNRHTHTLINVLACTMTTRKYDNGAEDDRKSQITIMTNAFFSSSLFSNIQEMHNVNTRLYTDTQMSSLSMIYFVSICFHSSVISEIVIRCITMPRFVLFSKYSLPNHNSTKKQFLK